ncbi:hypothetical protein BSL78_27923 [Apostichopus japonicus]|uniref:Uncharacterized protein n=1 Tax=Stichopus japonicus TaxID=307972 RepID=A0A2G8JHM3_STIJA|nr:hypothetical protein BSL78_27923 [Apostichopus japonicus]
MGSFDFADIPRRQKASPEFRELIRRLQSGPTNWASFTPERIRRACDQSVHLAPARFTYPQTRTNTSSATHSPREMPKRPSFRSVTRTSAGSSSMVRAGDMTAALTNILKGASVGTEPDIPAAVIDTATTATPRAASPLVVDVSSHDNASGARTGPCVLKRTRIENEGTSQGEVGMVVPPELHRRAQGLVWQVGIICALSTIVMNLSSMMLGVSRPYSGI